MCSITLDQSGREDALQSKRRQAHWENVYTKKGDIGEIVRLQSEFFKSQYVVAAEQFKLMTGSAVGAKDTGTKGRRK